MAGEYRRGNLLTLIWDWDKYHDLAMANVDNAVADINNFKDTDGEYLGDEYVQDWIEEQEQAITKRWIIWARMLSIISIGKAYSILMLDGSLKKQSKEVHTMDM